MRHEFFQWQAYRRTGSQKGSICEVTAWPHFRANRGCEPKPVLTAQASDQRFRQARNGFFSQAWHRPLADSSLSGWTEPAAFAKLNLRYRHARTIKQIERPGARPLRALSYRLSPRGRRTYRSLQLALRAQDARRHDPADQGHRR